MIFRVLFILILITIFPFSAFAEKIPRTIIALYSSKQEDRAFNTHAHRNFEMPLNHLGLKVEYYDVLKGLPDIKDRKDVRGVFTAFLTGMTMEDPEAYLNWAINVLNSGKRFVIIGEPGFYWDDKDNPTDVDRINDFFEILGFKDEDEWVNITYDVNFVYKDKNLTDFERDIAGFIVPYQRVTAINKDVETYLIVRKGSDETSDAHLAMTTPKGGYIADGYAYYYNAEREDGIIKQWYIDPFLFLRKAFLTDDLPKPDTTTIAGRRIYYSHIDGDGWNNGSLLEEHRNKDYVVLSSEVILEKVLKEYPDLPVTVGIIAGDVHPDWSGSKESLEIAKEIIKLPHIELGSHTYSHPFYWEFFEGGDPEKERPFLHKYNTRTWEQTKIFDLIKYKLRSKESYKAELIDIYDVPRAYARMPFSIELEIGGSAEYISSLVDNDKRVEVIQWSGNTSPFERALELTRLGGMQNINGGDTRFDREYPSYIWVAPIGRAMGKEQQIYASNSNENTYTDLWRGRYHGFKYLVRTIRNTETPIRVKPLNVYYHMYSGERRASLNALLDNLEYARTQSIVPLDTSHFAAVAQGFYTTELVEIGKNIWRIDNRGRLQTIRFDDSIFRAVDFNRSKGIVGQRHFQGSLYVYLDESSPSPVIALKNYGDYFVEPAENIPYLIDSRWNVKELKSNGASFNFIAKGFGDGEMVWKVPKSGTYDVITSNGKLSVKSDKDGLLKFNVKESAIKPMLISVRYGGS